MVEDHAAKSAPSRAQGGVPAARESETPEQHHERQVIAHEKGQLKPAHDGRRRDGEDDVWKGIGLSGGGIRAATFSLGAMQAFAAHGLLGRIDYISSVSGGGYLGSSLQWWWSEARRCEAWEEAEAAAQPPKSLATMLGVSPAKPAAAAPTAGGSAQTAEQVAPEDAATAGAPARPGQSESAAAASIDRYGTGRESFPYGCSHLSEPVRYDDREVQKRNLGFLRNHGNYLIPGDGITVWSGVYVVLRTLLLSLIVWLPLLCGIFVVLQAANVLFAEAVGKLPQWLQFAGPYLAWGCDWGEFKDWECKFKLPPIHASFLVIYALTVVFFVLASLAFALLTRVPSEIMSARKITGEQIAYTILGALLLVVPFALYATRFAGSATWPLMFTSGLIGFALMLRFLFEIVFYKSAVNGSYLMRRTLEEWFGFIFLIGMVFLAAGLLPVLPWYAAATLAPAKAASNAPAAVVTGLFAGVFTVLSGAASALWGYYSLARKVSEGVAARIFAPLGAAIFLYGTMMLAYVVAVFLVDVTAGRDYPFRAVILASAPLVVIVAFYLSLRTNVNQIGLHRFYRDRLMEAFMPSARAVMKGSATYSPVADRLNIFDLGSSFTRQGRGGEPPVPYPILNAFARIVRPDDPKTARRGGDNFIISPFYVGSRATGWESAESYGKRYGPLTLATAMAASGAAVNSNAGYIGTGLTRDRLVSVVMTVLNMRLGIWVGNPARKGERRRTPVYASPTLTNGLIGWGRAHTSAFIEISDGGNFDNLGLYELARRKLGLIILVDGEADASIALRGLVSAAVRIKEDFGATLYFPDGLNRLVPVDKAVGYPPGAHFAAAPYVVGRIDYEDKSSSSVVIYVKATLTRNLDFTTLGYRAGNPDFPHQTTLDQFFDPVQFEAYRDIGYRSTARMIDELKLASSDTFPASKQIWERYADAAKA